MYAIIECCGRQYKVAEGDVVFFEKLDAEEGKKVALIDTDIGLRNLDVVMGLENRIVYDIVDVVEGKCKLRQALIKDKRFKELYLLPAAQTRDKSAVNEEQKDIELDRYNLFYHIRSHLYCTDYYCIT